MQHQKIKSTLLVLLTMLSYTVFSQIEIKNKIVDFTNLLPIESASIYVQNTTIGTVSNADGKFVLLVPEEFL